MDRHDSEGSIFQASAEGGEQGFMLLGLMVAIAILMLFLGVAASDVAYSLRRDKEVESARRADQYVRAIRLFYLKFGRYPGSIEQLENTNHVRYLRQQYVDPLTGQADYRLIAVGQNKTVVAGFFGQPLGGLSAVGAGSMGGGLTPGNGTGTVVGGGIGNDASSGTKNSGGTNGGGPGIAGGGIYGGGSSGSGVGGPGTNGTATGASPMGSPIGGAGTAAAVGPIMGVGSSASGPSILTVNGQTSYDTWEFLYDPRLELLKAAAALNGAAAGALNGGTGIGQPPVTSQQQATPHP